MKLDGTNFPIINLPIPDCYHGSLEFLKHFINLIELDICFGLENCGYFYKKHFFDCSYNDIENLGLGIEALRYLHTFRIQFTSLDERKVKTIMNVLSILNIRIIDFSYCDLKDDCCYPIGEFLMKNVTIEELLLRGNFIGPDGCKSLGYGIKNCNGKLNVLNISMNPILEDGLISLGGGFVSTHHVSCLNVSGCDLGKSGSGTRRLCQIISWHTIMEKFNISNIHLNKLDIDKLIDCLEANTSVYELDVRGCKLTKDEEVKINILVKRNRFYREHKCLNKKFIAKDNMPEVIQYVTENR